MLVQVLTCIAYTCYRAGVRLFWFYGDHLVDLATCNGLVVSVVLLTLRLTLSLSPTRHSRITVNIFLVVNILSHSRWVLRG